MSKRSAQRSRGRQKAAKRARRIKWSAADFARTEKAIARLHVLRSHCEAEGRAPLRDEVAMAMRSIL